MQSSGWPGLAEPHSDNPLVFEHRPFLENQPGFEQKEMMPVKGRRRTAPPKNPRHRKDQRLCNPMAAEGHGGLPTGAWYCLANVGQRSCNSYNSTDNLGEIFNDQGYCTPSFCVCPCEPTPKVLFSGFMNFLGAGILPQCSVWPDFHQEYRIGLIFTLAVT